MIRSTKYAAILIPGEREIVAVALHAHHDQADAIPGVEPSVEHDELADRLPLFEEHEAEGGGEESAARV